MLSEIPGWLMASAWGGLGIARASVRRLGWIVRITQAAGYELSHVNASAAGDVLYISGQAGYTDNGKIAEGASEPKEAGFF